MRITHYILYIIHCRLALALSALLVLASCSQTSHLAEGEVLYKGIREISYGQKARSVVAQQAETDQQQEGVITAVARAINDVDALLSGGEDIDHTLAQMRLNATDGRITRQQRDSIQHQIDIMTEAYDAARTEVDAALACQPNGSLFGSSKICSPWPLGLYFHNWFADSHTLVGKWIYNTFAKQPVCISTVNPATRVRVAQNILRNYGFFNAEAEYDILYNSRDSLKARIAYSIYPRNLYRLDSIEWRGFAQPIDSIIARSSRNSNLHRGDAFNVQNLDAERNRVSELLRGNGYYNFRPDYVRFRADTVQVPGKVQLRIEPANQLDSTALRRYSIGHTYITMLKYDDTEIVDTIPNPHRLRHLRQPRHRQPQTPNLKPRTSNLTMYYSGRRGQQPLRLSEIRKRLFYQQADLYNATRMDIVKNQLSAIGVFSQLRIDYRPRPNLSTDSTANDTLDVYIYAMLDKPYDSEFAANIVNKSNGLLGPSLSYSISKKNAFRRAETLKLKIYGSYEWQIGSHIDAASSGSVNSYELGAQLSLHYPRLVMLPARRLNRHSLATTEFALDASWLNRAGYYSMGQFKGEVAYNYQSRPYVKHRIVPLSLRYQTIMNESAQFASLLSQRPVLQVSMRDQMVPSMEYTLALTSRRRAHNPRSFTLSLKQAGNVTSALYATFGRSMGQRDKQLLGVPFAQFVRVAAEGKAQIHLTPRTSLVGHIAAGAVYSYGNSTAAPYNDLFYVGGANSIRAFCIRGVGPGRYHPSNSGYSYIDQMGDIKLEMNLEYRFPIVGDLGGALFVDAGNVWLMNDDPKRPGGTLSLKHFANDLALGTGLGVRYDLSFLVIRLDVGVALHAPYETRRSGYYNMTSFGRSLGYHFAVGYPF